MKNEKSYKIQSIQDCVSRQVAINALWKALYEYEDKTEKQFQESDELDISDWISHRIFVQNMSDIDRQTILNLPPAQPNNDWVPVTKKAHPDLPIRVQVQMDNGWIITAYYQDGEWLSVPDFGEPIQDKWIEAWRELPELYEERRKE